MSDFEELFDGKKQEETQAIEPTQVEAPAPEPVDEPKVESEAQEVPAAEDGETTAPGQGKNVPLSALEAERQKRQDWKEKAIRYEERIKQLEQAQQQPQQPQGPNREMSLDERLFNERAHVSEMLIRQKHQDVDDKVAAFEQAAKQNPALAAAVMQQQDPWGFVYQQGARMLAMQEIGEDPAAYRERVREEIRQEMLNQQAPVSQPHQSPAAALPPSLAGARSSAARNAQAFTGPVPFDDLFKT